MKRRNVTYFVVLVAMLAAFPLVLRAEKPADVPVVDYAREARLEAERALNAAYHAMRLAEKVQNGVDSATLETLHRTLQLAKTAKSNADSAIMAYSVAEVERRKYVKAEAMQDSVDRFSPEVVGKEVDRLRDDVDSLLIRQRVIVGKDTVNLIIPERNLGRYDRGLLNFLYIPKGKWAFGLTASYGEFDTEDVQVLSFLKDFNFKGSMFSISPTVSYFVRHNQAVGMKIGYSRNKFLLGSLSVDIDEDINFSLKDVDYHTESYSAALFYRRYIGLDNGRRFAIFNDVELGFSSGNGSFTRLYDDKPKETRTLTTKASLNFSPGLCVFIQEYVSVSISFGVFGVSYSWEKQRTNGIDEGTRSVLGTSFKFNLFKLNMGVAVHI